MNRRFLSCLLFSLCLSSMAWAQSRPAAAEPPAGTPAWLPHGAMVGLSIRSNAEEFGEGTALSPQVRLLWAVPFFRGRKDTLSLIFEPLASYTAGYPSTVDEDTDVDMRALRLFSLVVGVGYRNRPRRGEGMEWGFQVGTGPAWYAARFDKADKDRESYWVGLIDGRAQVGYSFGAYSLGVAVGYSDPYNYRRTSLARPYVGGLHLGLYLEWR